MTWQGGFHSIDLFGQTAAHLLAPPELCQIQARTERFIRECDPWEGTVLNQTKGWTVNAYEIFKVTIAVEG